MTLTQLDDFPMPPDPPASFGVLGPEYELELPALCTADVPPALDDVTLDSSDADGSPKPFVPVRRRDRIAEDAGGAAAPMPTQPQRRLAASIPPPPSWQSPASGQPPSHSGTRPIPPPPWEPPAPDPRDWVAAGAATAAPDVSARDAYLAASREYKTRVGKAFDGLQAARTGDLVQSGPSSLALYERVIKNHLTEYPTANAHAKMERGRKEQPVVLVLSWPGGSVVRKAFAEHHRAAVKQFAAAVRKQGGASAAKQHTLELKQQVAKQTLLLEARRRRALDAAAARYATELNKPAPPVPDLEAVLAHAETMSRAAVIRAAHGSVVRPAPADWFRELRPIDWFRQLSPMGQPAVIVLAILIALSVIGAIAGGGQ